MNQNGGKRQDCSVVCLVCSEADVFIVWSAR